MTERPILFSAPMLRAIRDDSKTRTRRMVKTQLPFCQPHPGGGWIFTDAKLASEDVARYAIGAHGMLCPYGQPGDRLWVRETWAPVDYLVGSKLEDPVCVAFAADQTAWSYAGTPANKPRRLDTYGWPWDRVKWKPSIHMPRWASRITLEVTGVRAERLQDISEEDAYAEGVLACDGLIDEADIARASKLCGVAIDDARALFFALFATIYGWELLSLNPWVWVVEFRRLP